MFDAEFIKRTHEPIIKELEIEINRARYKIRYTLGYTSEHDKVDDLVRKNLKICLVRDRWNDILEQYYGHAINWPIQKEWLATFNYDNTRFSGIDRKSLKVHFNTYRYLQSIIPCVYSYQMDQRGLFYWRDILRVIPKRPRCRICGAPPTRWDRTAHGKRKGDDNDRYNCLGGESYVYAERLRKWREEYRIKQEKKKGIWQARIAALEAQYKIKEDKKCLQETRQLIWKIKKYLRNPNSLAL